MNAVSQARLRMLLLVLAASLIVGAEAFAQTTRFRLQVLPPMRMGDDIAWHDVNGDGRKDLIHVRGRHLEAYLLGKDGSLEIIPSWQVDIEPPWDLWDFADVRSAQPGEELLMLRPEGVGWMSYHNRETANAGFQTLVEHPLPVVHDNVRLSRGHYVTTLRRDHPPDLLLPDRAGLQIVRRAKAFGQWEQGDLLSGALITRPRFNAGSSVPFLLGFGEWPMVYGLRKLSGAQPSRLEWDRFQLQTRRSATPGRLIDWNGDGRLDWIAAVLEKPSEEWNVYLQGTDGTFDRENPVTPVWPPEPADRDEDAGSESPFEPMQGPLPMGGERQWENLADINGDGRLDLLRFSSLDNWAAPKTRVAVHLQRPGATFREEPDSLLRLRAVMPVEGLPLSDLDGDGDLDLMLLRIDLQVASVNSHMKAFFQKGLETQLGAYLWQGRDGFMKRPAWEKQIIISHDMFEFTREPQPLMHFDRDFAGDARPDLALRISRTAVGIYSTSGPRGGFSDDPVARLETPFGIESLEVDDFDGNGTTDLLVAGWDSGEPERVRIAVFYVERQRQ